MYPSLFYITLFGIKEAVISLSELAPVPVDQ